MVRRGLAESRQRARELIEDHRVTVAGAPVTKPARLVDPGDAVVVAGPPPPYVSRGGQKLAAALDRFDISPEGRRVIDCGASTGGFTDCLLQRGATEVVAIDVGRGQLHQSLRTDPRVQSHERANVRHVRPGQIGGRAALVVADLSFISLRTVMAALVDLVDDGGSLVALVKPQFEAGRRSVSEGRGVIRDPALWADAMWAARTAADAAGAVMIDAMVSPLTGADGNVEFLVHIIRDDTAQPLDHAALGHLAAEAARP